MIGRAMPSVNFLVSMGSSGTFAMKDKIRLELPGFLKSDFYRLFAIGFVLGGILVWTQMPDTSPQTVVPTAVAAPGK